MTCDYERTSCKWRDKVVPKLEAENKRLKKVLKKIEKHPCTGEAAYDALSCDGYVPKSRWCGPCMARATLKGGK